MKKIAYDSTKMDALKIVEDSDCCLKVTAVISKTGVYEYDDGLALKSVAELHKATRTARYAKLTIGDHPESKVIMNQNQLYGGVESPYFDRNKIRGILCFDKYVTPRPFIENIKTAIANKIPIDNSIGFYYTSDPTPGIDTDVNTGEKRRYDYVMRDIMIDHVVIVDKPGVKGRCTFPQCGVGVDTMMMGIGYKEDMVVQRGNQYCVIHCHGPEAGKAIKCFATKEEAEAMHRAIQAQKHVSTQGTDDGRPPSDWWDSCISKAQSFADDPTQYCGWLWVSGPEQLKSSFGGASTKGGVIGISETKPDKFALFVKQLVAEGYTEQQMKDYWDAYVAGTKELPTSIPTTPPSTIQPPVAKPPEVITKAPEETAKPPTPPLPPPENLTAEQLVDRSKELLAMREQRVIEERRADRRHPA